jgi:hypothetical protein
MGPLSSSLPAVAMLRLPPVRWLPAATPPSSGSSAPATAPVLSVARAASCVAQYCAALRTLAGLSASCISSISLSKLPLSRQRCHGAGSTASSSAGWARSWICSRASVGTVVCGRAGATAPRLRSCSTVAWPAFSSRVACW